MKTIVDFIPRGDYVLLRADFRISSLNILNDEVINKIPAESYYVVAMSDTVLDLEVGDKVKIEPNIIPILINIPNNTQSLRAKQEVYKSGKAISGVSDITFSEYILVHSYSVIGVWKNVDRNAE